MEIDQMNRKRLSVLASGQAQDFFESLEAENDKRSLCVSPPGIEPHGTIHADKYQKARDLINKLIRFSKTVGLKYYIDQQLLLNCINLMKSI